MGFVDDLTSDRVLQAAWEKVRANQGAPGIDRVTIAGFGADLRTNLDRLRHEISTLRYRPLPVLRIRPKFLGAKDRPLVVLTVRDRVVQRAMADLLSPRIDPLLRPSCRAFRKGSSATGAADDLARWIENGTPWVLRADIQNFFDSIQPEPLQGMLKPLVDEDGLRLITQTIRCRIFDRDQISDMICGIAQGSPLSPLLANLYLTAVDADIEKEHSRYIRYCDDLVTLGSSKSEMEAAQDQITHLLVPLGLALNSTKTRVCRAEDGFVFLGYHFGAAGRGPSVKAVEALQFRIEEIVSKDHFAGEELDAVYRGWTNYFGLHPGCWTSSLGGLLALLRQSSTTETEVAGFIESRWRQANTSKWLGFLLAQAWLARGRPEQGWLEWAAVCGQSQTAPAAHEPWAQLLGVAPAELTSLASRLSGPAEDRLAVLGEALAELGFFDLAGKVSQTQIAAADSSEPKISEPEEADIDDIALLQSWFRGREGVHAVESVNRAGHRSFVPLNRPIEADDWRAHLKGERALALPLVRAGDTSLIGVLDIDIDRKALADLGGFPDELLGRALGAALRLKGELTRRGCPSLLEFSGYKGYHLWIRLEAPVTASLLRRWLLEIVQSVSPLPENVRVEEFPNCDHVRPDAVGPVVKLPLGFHSKTGKRCLLLNDQGRELENPFGAIKDIRPVSAQRLGLERPAAESVAAAPKLGPKAQLMVEGCHVLGYLKRRAEETSYLNHRERSSLLYTLGHLGKEGAEALHSIISHTYNYRRDVTERHIQRLLPWPISCPKLRLLHPEAIAFGSCTCEFKLRGRAYPTPVLFGLKASEVPVFKNVKASKEPATVPPAATEISPGPAEQPTASPEQTIRRLSELKRQRTKLEASIRDLENQLLALFDQHGVDVIELSLGFLRRKRRGDDDQGWDFSIEI